MARHHGSLARTNQALPMAASATVPLEGRRNFLGLAGSGVKLCKISLEPFSLLGVELAPAGEEIGCITGDSTKFFSWC
jgi:hypothetical protein